MSTFYTSPTFEPMFFPTFEPILEQPQQQLMYSDQTLYESPTFTPSSTFGSSPTNVFYPYGFTFPTYPYTPQSSHSSSSSYSSSSFSGPPTASPALIFGQPDPTLFETETSYFEPHIPFPTSLPTPPTPLAETVNPFEAASPTFIASPPVTKKRSRTAQACEKCRIRKAKVSLRHRLAAESSALATAHVPGAPPKSSVASIRTTCDIVNQNGPSNSHAKNLLLVHVENLKPPHHHSVH